MTTQSRRRRFHRITLLAFMPLALLTVVAGANPGVPAAFGIVHYSISSRDSDVRFLVYRAGILATLGHDHVVRATELKGDIYADTSNFQRSRFRLDLPVSAFRVDNPGDRKGAGPGFTEQPSARAVAATTRNMLSSRVLDADKYPEVGVRSTAINGTPRDASIKVRITLRGASRELEVPVRLDVTDRRLVAVGDFKISQRNFGITPYAALAGALKVEDVVKVRFRIVATKDQEP